jgi:hypothetical protein
MRRMPKFASIKAEREFWDGHDAIEVLGEVGWKVSEAGATKVKSVYVAKVGRRGAVIHVPREWLLSIGAKKGQKIKGCRGAAGSAADEHSLSHDFHGKDSHIFLKRQRER